MCVRAYMYIYTHIYVGYGNHFDRRVPFCIAAKGHHINLIATDMLYKIP